MKNKKLLITALSLILCLAVSIGFAVAYFTDYEAAKGGAVLNLSGRTEIEESVKGKEKTVSIKNVGDTDVVTRVMIVGEKMDVTLGDGWTDRQEDGWYYYTKVLKCDPEDHEKGEATNAIKAKITISGTEELKDYDIIVVHESSRVVYDGDKVVVPEGWANVAISAE